MAVDRQAIDCGTSFDLDPVQRAGKSRVKPAKAQTLSTIKLPHPGADGLVVPELAAGAGP